MSDRSLDFRAPMIRALLNGRKTQDRRVLKPQPKPHATFFAYDLGDNGFFARWLEEDEQGNCDLPFARIPAMKGDRLWVKEAWRPLQYEADGAQMNWIASEHGFGTEAGRYRHARFMPRWASRLTLIVTDVQVQRLQEISEADAVAEGIEPSSSRDQDYSAFHARTSFQALWNSLHGPDAWDANPWVTALTFTVHNRNIDKMETDQ